MFEERYRHTRFVDTIVNATENEEEIYMYEQSSGSLKRAEPQDVENVCPSPCCCNHTICNIVSKSQIKDIKRNHPDWPLDNFGILAGEPTPGRHNKPIGRVRWAKDPEIEILLYPSESRHSFTF